MRLGLSMSSILLLSLHMILCEPKKFELFCKDHGVLPQKYMSDNASAFTSKSFTDHLKIYRQRNSFAFAGAHHYDGIAERSTRTIMTIARTMMLHSAIHWPDMADATLWPMAVSHVVFLWNHLPGLETGLSPSDLFTKSRWPQQRFHDLHVWGCPVYVLNKTISDGSLVPLECSIWVFRRSMPARFLWFLIPLLVLLQHNFMLCLMIGLLLLVPLLNNYLI